jgi:hypothetical protein
MSAQSKEAEYRRYAGSLIDLASRASTKADKFRLLVMASDWLNLADKIARLTRRRRCLEAGFHDPITRDQKHASPTPTRTDLHDC